MEIVAQQMVTDLSSSFGQSFMNLAGVEMAHKAALDCYRSSGLTAQDVDVLEVHDCFSCNEVKRSYVYILFQWFVWLILSRAPIKASIF